MIEIRTLSRFLVGAEGFEDTTNTREKPGNTADGAEEAPKVPTVRVGSDGPDAALKEAIHQAIDAGLYERARTLLDVLTKTSAAADVVDLRDRRKL